MKTRHKILALICLIPGLSFLQSCTLEDQLLFTWAFLIQERWRDGGENLVFNTYIGKHLALGCGILSISGKLPPDLMHRPSRLKWILKGFESGVGEFEHSYVTPVGEDGTFDRSFDTPGSNHINGSGTKTCPNWEFNPNTGLDMFVTAFGGFVPIDSLVAGVVAMRPIEKLKRCTPKILATSGVPNRASWWKTRPGKSTLQVVATGSTIGVKVHCVKTKTGAQGTVRVTNTNGKTDFIAIQCD